MRVGKAVIAVFTLGNFIKFLIVTVLTAATVNLPILGNIGELAGGGPMGAAIGFAFLFLFWWFLVGQVIAFFAFAFGGGVGKYHTTKLYRHLQFITFVVLMSVPVLTIATLLLNLSPFSIYPKGYDAAVKRIKAERLATAQAAQQSQITQANAQRLQSIANARAEREAKINQALRAREMRIESAKLERQHKIDQAKRARQTRINAAEAKRTAAINKAKAARRKQMQPILDDRRKLAKALRDREKKITAFEADIKNQINAENQKRKRQYLIALEKWTSSVGRETKSIRAEQTTQLRALERKLRSERQRLIRQERTLQHTTSGTRFKKSMAALTTTLARSILGKSSPKLIADIQNAYSTYDAYKIAKQTNCSQHTKREAFYCSLFRTVEIAGDNRKNRRFGPKRTKLDFFVARFGSKIFNLNALDEKVTALEETITQTSSSFEARIAEVERRHPKPLHSDFPPVDAATYPKADNTRFPPIDENLYPLANAKDLPPVDLSKFPKVDLRKFPEVDLSQFPPVDMSKFPPVNMAKFPTIDESNYPLIKVSDYPLKIDNSAMYIEGSAYWERLEPTFQAHWWWFMPLVFLIFFAFFRDMQFTLSKICGRVIRFLDEGGLGYGGVARFATMIEEWGKPYKSGTLYMGRSLYNAFDEIGIDGEAHMLTVAGSRGGKGTTAIIPNLLLWEGSAVVIDPKGTNAHVTAQARRDMGQNVHIIDPFGVVTKESDRFDPFAGVHAEDPIVRERITSIADALVIPDENAKDKHWDDGARSIISGLIAHVISQEDEDKALHNIRDLITQFPKDQDRLWAEMAFNAGAGGAAKDAATRYIRGMTTNEILSILSSADKHTEWLSSPTMRNVTSNPTFAIKDIKEKPTTIYLVIPPLQLQRQNRLLRLFINLVIDAMEDGGRSKIPVLMMIDEFLALGKMQEITNAFATMASYNLTIWPFVQDIGRMEELYGEGFNAIVANSRAIQVFSVSDQKTKEYISERLGSRPISGLADISKSNDNLPLRAPNDIEIDLAAEERRQYVIQSGKSAMLIEKVPYYDSAPSKLLRTKGRFHGKYDPDPDFV